MSTKLLTEQYILEEIGQGSQGKLYKATDKESGAVVAMKRLQLKKATAIDDVHRLEDAARALEQISHPHVVGYRGTATREDDCGSPEFWLSMEYVDGTSLAHAMRNGRRLTEEELYAIAEQTLEGLAATHARGIVHRDVKPSNILQTEDRTVKLADFGIAKFLGEQTRGSSLIGKGTTEYMAPEQFDPKLPITPATDYYGLGMTLLELATGRERKGAYFHEDPKEDIAALRKSDHLSKKFVDDLELLVDANPEKRKEGVRRMRETMVVSPVKSVEEVVAAEEEEKSEENSEEKVWEKTYHYPEGVVRWKEPNYPQYAQGVGLLGAAIATVFQGAAYGLDNPDLLTEGPEWQLLLSMADITVLGAYLGYKWAQFVDGRREKKAKEAVGIRTIKKYDPIKRKGIKNAPWQGVMIGDEHYIVNTKDIRQKLSVRYGSKGIGEIVEQRYEPPQKAYRFLYYNPETREAEVQETTDKALLTAIQQQYVNERAPKPQLPNNLERELKAYAKGKISAEQLKEQFDIDIGPLEREVFADGGLPREREPIMQALSQRTGGESDALIERYTEALRYQVAEKVLGTRLGLWRKFQPEVGAPPWFKGRERKEEELRKKVEEYLKIEELLMGAKETCERSSALLEEAAQLEKAAAQRTLILAEQEMSEEHSEQPEIVEQESPALAEK